MIYGLDLFSGIGGITLALKDYVQPILYCEIDKFAQASLISNMGKGLLPKAPIWDNITTLKWEDLRENGFPKAEIIYGGFPCQDISQAGLGKGLAGKRSGLFYEILRLANEIRPQFIFLENVSAILIRGLDTVLTEITKIGYDCRWTINRACEYGIPMQRARWWLLGSAIGGVRNINSKVQKTKDNIKSIKTRFAAKVELPTPPNWKDYSPDGTVYNDYNGLSTELDEIKGLGNAVVPIQAISAFEKLIGIQNETPPI